MIKLFGKYFHFALSRSVTYPLISINTSFILRSKAQK